MKIEYKGPSESVNVAPYGPHKKDEVKEYPEEFGLDLLETSRKQQFELVEDGVIALTDKAPKDMTVAQLKALLHDLAIDYPANAKKDDLVSMLEDYTAEPPEED